MPRGSRRRLRATVLALALALPTIGLSSSHPAAAAAAPGSLLAWGDNDTIGPGYSSPTPVAGALPAGVTITALAANAVSGSDTTAVYPSRSERALALTSTGEVLSWSIDPTVQGNQPNAVPSYVGCQSALPADCSSANHLTGIRAIAAGADFYLAVTSAGQVLGWGDDTSGQLGDGGGASGPVYAKLPAGTTVTRVAAGGAFALALTSEGQVLSWGANDRGQLGNGQVCATTSATTAACTTSPKPSQVQLPAGATATSIASGYDDGYALTSAGQVLAWGANNTGQLGNGNAAQTGYTAYVGVNPPPSSDGVNDPTPALVCAAGATLPCPAGPYLSDVAAVAGGGFHALALLTSGQVMSWGSNTFGELGRATSAAPGSAVQVGPASFAPGPVPGIDAKVTAIAAGIDHSLALTSAQRVWAWGLNTYGQLGNGHSGGSTLTPAPVTTDAPLTAPIAAGGGSSMATAGTAPDLTVTKTHSPRSFLQGGTGTYTITVTNSGSAPTAGPVSAKDPLPAGLSPLSATGPGWGCAISEQAVTCTRSDPLAPGTSYPAITISVSVAPAAAALTNTVTVSGGGELNTSNDSANDPTPVLDPYPDLTVGLSHPRNLQQGGTGTYTITVSNVGGVSTSGTVTASDTLPGGVTPVSPAGTGWTCGPASGKTVSCTRSDALAPGGSYPPLSVQVSVPPTAQSFTNTVTVAGGGEVNTSNDSASDPTWVSGAPRSTLGVAFAWGTNYYGDTGTGATSSSGCFCVPTPTAVSTPSGTTVTAVSGDLALTGPPYAAGGAPAGQVLTWGGGSGTPAPVTLPPATTVTAIASGPRHRLALTSAGQVLAWGNNDRGQLGNGAPTSGWTATPAPIDLSALQPGDTVTALAAGEDYGLVLTSMGEVWAWGADERGAVGTGTTPNSGCLCIPSPARVSLPPGAIITAIAAGGQHALALTSTGQVLAWGNNDLGQLGTGTASGSGCFCSPTPIPAALPPGTTASAIAAGGNHSLAVVTSMLLSWGSNGSGQLGAGAVPGYSPAPVAVKLPTGTTVGAIAAGEEHSLAITGIPFPGGTPAGHTLAWGANDSGELGDGTTVPRTSPIPVAGMQNAVAVAGAGRGSLGIVTQAISLTSSVNPSTRGQPVTYTATVMPSQSGGTVAFIDGDVTIPGCAAQPLAGGIATCTTTPAGGTHSVVASYVDLATGTSNASPPLLQVVRVPVYGAASAVRIESPTLPGAVPDLCQAGPVQGYASAGTVNGPCAAPVPLLLPGAAVLGAGPVQTVTTDGLESVAARSSGSLKLNVDGILIEATGLSASSAITCGGTGPTSIQASSTVARLSIDGYTVATSPVGSRMAFDATRGRPIVLYGSPISVNPTGSRVPMAVITLNDSSYDPSSHRQVSSPVVIEFPARGPLHSQFVGRIFLSYAETGCP